MTFDLQTGGADTGAEAPSWLPITGEERRGEERFLLDIRYHIVGMTQYYLFPKHRLIT